MKGHRLNSIPIDTSPLSRTLAVWVRRSFGSAALGWACLAWILGPMLSASAQQPAPIAPTEGVVGTTMFRGQELTFTVVDGVAIHGGDVVLGTAAEVLASAPYEAPSQGLIVAQQDSAQEQDHLWPGGVIPYVIDEDVTNSEDILRAIGEWNSKTVISLVERTTEQDYVRFRSAAAGCRAHQGRMGGEQFIWLHETCDWRVAVHEIGHAVGLWHEHQRQDRDRYLMVHDRFVEICSNPFDLRPEARVDRPYDYSSTMHYGRGPFGDLPWVDTIPPGISIVSAFTPAPLSSGDIDYVARLYGRPPTATTISTNPPGLDVIVDGVLYATPATFDWAAGSTHSIEAPSVQTGNNPILGDCCNYVESSSEGERSRFIFAGWTDEGERAHSVTADPETTWYQANYIVQLEVAPRAEPSGYGEMTIRPESPDGFYTVGSPVEISAVANPGYYFLEWRGQWMPGSDRINWYSGDSWNPARMHVGLNGRAPQIHATFWDLPVFAIDARGYVHGAHIFNNRGHGVSLPRNYPVDTFRSQFEVEDGTIQVTVADDGVSFEGIEPSPGFLRWEDGVIGTRIEDDRFVREVVVPDEGGRMVTEWETHVPLFDARVSGAGRVDVYPPPLSERKPGYWSDTSYYVQDTRVELTAVPESPDSHFVGWVGNARGTDAVTGLVMDGPKRVEALFSDLPILRSDEPQSGNPAAGRGYWTYVPFGATGLAVDVEMQDVQGSAILAVSQGTGEIWIDENGRVQGAEFQAQLNDGRARIAITRETSPPISDGPYFVRVIATQPDATGSLTATVTDGTPVRASPRAFTYVVPEGFDPAPQTFELTNMADRPLSFLVESDRTWLRAEPRQGTLAAGETTQITAMVSGTGLLSDIHRGNLTILDAIGTYERSSVISEEENVVPIGTVVFSEGASLPVTFALISPGS